MANNVLTLKESSEHFHGEDNTNTFPEENADYSAGILSIC